MGPTIEHEGHIISKIRYLDWLFYHLIRGILAYSSVDSDIMFKEEAGSTNARHSYILWIRVIHTEVYYDIQTKTCLSSF